MLTEQRSSSTTRLPRVSIVVSPDQPKRANSDVDDLRRFSRLSRRLKMRQLQQQQQQHQQQPQQLQKFERHAVQRRSMPEIQRADLVYLRMPAQAQHQTSNLKHVGFRSEEQLNYADWKPRTEFERTYFGGDLHPDNNPRPSSSLNYYECNDQHLLKKLDDDALTARASGYVDQNSNLIGSESSSTAKMIEDDCYDPEVPRRLDDYVVPHSPEFRTSRERLHEIFEHNRYLRRKFFADLPTGSNNNSSNNNNNNNNKHNNINENDNEQTKFQTTTKSSSGLGFGSTETLTSQSNQSAGSSTDGRKSRAELFGNTPDSSLMGLEQAKPKPALPLTYFGADRYGGTWRSTAKQAVIDDIERSTGKPSGCDEATEREDEMASWNAPPGQQQRRSFLESSDRRGRKSMPNLSPNDMARLSVNGSAIELARNRESSSRTKDDNDSDTKYFASYVHVTDSSSSSSSSSDDSADSSNKRFSSKMDRNDKRAQSSEQLERDFLAESRPFHEAWSAELRIARSRESLLRSSRSLLELSSPTILAGGANRRETRIERMIRRRGQSAFNKSCSDLSSMIEPEQSRLVSPRLVGDAQAASRERLAELEEEQEEEQQQEELEDNQALAAGSTLNSVYGPIPYKSPRRYVEGEVTIHYRSPVRSEAKEPLSEEELARRSAENMRRVYQEERRRKYLQELHDIDSRRHTDNFIPSQKSPIPLNRYDDFVDDLSYRSRSQEQTPEPRLVARALYNFVGQTPRELTFRRGDLIFVRRQVDKNWYEGEHNAMIGLFPFNYVEIIPYDEIRTLPKKSYEGQARAKFNFIAQTNLELSLAKGELVYLSRRVDENWWEGRIGNRKGIFPVSYVDVLNEPGPRPETPIQNKPVASPAAHSMLSNGTSSGKLSMGAHHYSPSLPVGINTAQPNYNSLPKGGSKLHVAPVNETLHIDTHSEPIPYRALYNYRPQNEDELELNEGDTVYVMEKCDDGWYVGSSQRTGYFGTFPGNYVERL